MRYDREQVRQLNTAEALKARPGPFEGRRVMEDEVTRILRAQVNDGFMACRKALEEAQWDIEEAKKILRRPEYPAPGCPK